MGRYGRYLLVTPLLDQLLDGLTSYRACSLLAINGRCRCSVPHFGALPVVQGPGKSRLMRDWSGPLSLCSFGSEKTGTFANFFLRSILERDLERFGMVNLFRGTSSPLYVRSLAPGYLIGDGFFLVSFSSWGLLFVVDQVFWFGLSGLLRGQEAEY